MPSWDPAQYAKFGDHRLRPALDLIGRIPDIQARRIVDLGCGPGEITEMLAARWPEAETVGLDSSPDMLKKARALNGRARYVDGDAAAWSPDPKVDLLFSNACLQWLPDHERLFPRLVEQVTKGGTIAIQMPQNLHHLSLCTSTMHGANSQHHFQSLCRAVPRHCVNFRTRNPIRRPPHPPPAAAPVRWPVEPMQQSEK